jgi:hypothetical protein
VPPPCQQFEARGWSTAQTPAGVAIAIGAAQLAITITTDDARFTEKLDRQVQATLGQTPLCWSSADERVRLLVYRCATAQACHTVMAPNEAQVAVEFHGAGRRFLATPPGGAWRDLGPEAIGPAELPLIDAALVAALCTELGSALRRPDQYAAAEPAPVPGAEADGPQSGGSFAASLPAGGGEGPPDVPRARGTSAATKHDKANDDDDEAEDEDEPAPTTAEEAADAPAAGSRATAGNGADPASGSAECAQFLKLWMEVTDAPHITVVAIMPDTQVVHARTFPRGTEDAACAWIADHQATGRNVYFQPNETRADCHKKPGKVDMVAALCRFADVDPADALFPLAEERDRLARLAAFLAASKCPPTCIIDSGNGIQPLWAVIREALTPEVTARVEAETAALERTLGAGGTHNIDRLLRLPGTANYPTKAKMAKGRGVTRARLIFAGASLYRSDQVASLVTDDLVAAGLVRPRRGSSNSSPGVTADPADVKALIADLEQAGGNSIQAETDLPEALRQRLAAALALDLETMTDRDYARRKRLADRWAGLVDDLTEAGRDDSRSGADMSLAAMLKATGFTHLDCALALLAFRHGKANNEEWPAETLRLRHVARSVLRSHEPTPADPLNDPTYQAHQARDAVEQARRDDDPVPPRAEPPPLQRAHPDVAPEWPQPLRLVAFRGIAGEFVARLLPETEADPAGLLFQFLTMFGNFVGTGPHFRVESTRHPARLSPVLVGATSKGRKGTSFDRVREFFGLVAPDWAKDHIVTGMTSGEGLIHAVRDPRWEWDKKEQDLVQVDAGVADKRLLVISAEFASLLKVMIRPGNTLSALLRQCWDTGDLQNLNKNSPERATGAHISLISHITAEELRRSLDEVEYANGFANRLLFLGIRRARMLPFGGKRMDWTDLAPRLGKAATTARNSGELDFDAAAAECWRGVYGQLSDAQAGLLGAITARAEAQVIRLALIYALLDGAQAIGLDHLEAALECWRYARDSARFIFGDALGDPIADTILVALRQETDGLTQTQISELFARNVTASKIAAALQTLLKVGRVRTVSRATAGRPATIWQGL